jgi:hypothetical protein
VKHTVHVLAATNGPRTPTGDAPPSTPRRPDEILTFVGRSTLPAVEELADRFHKAGYSTRVESVAVPVNQANPTEIAATLAMLRLGDRSLRDYRGRIDRVSVDAARQVPVADAGTYLGAVHDLHLTVGSVTGPVEPLALAALRLARRAKAGDPFANLALMELAAESRAIEDQDMPADVDPLTVSNAEGWDR